MKAKYLKHQLLFNLLNNGKTTSCIVTNNYLLFANKSDTNDCINQITVRVTVQSTLVTHQRIPSLKDDAFNTAMLNFNISQ